MDRLTVRLPAQKVAAGSHTVAEAQQAIVPKRPAHAVYPWQFDLSQRTSVIDIGQQLGLLETGSLVGRAQTERRETITGGGGLLAIHSDAKQPASPILRYMGGAALRHQVGRVTRTRAQCSCPEQCVENRHSVIRTADLVQ